MFIYYVSPKDKSNVRREIKGVLPALDGENLTMREVFAGPDSCSGLIFGLMEIPKYIPKEQTWTHIESVKTEVFPDGFWIGYDKLPKPPELERKNKISGHLVKLGDGNQWEIPVARLYTGEPMVSQVLKLDPSSGKMLMEIEGKYKRIWEIACEYYELRVGAYEANADNFKYTFSDIFDLCAEIMGANYVIGKWEISLMGLVNTENLREILEALIDMPRIWETFGKKK
jgi:hypothetical protein